MSTHFARLFRSLHGLDRYLILCIRCHQNSNNYKTHTHPPYPLWLPDSVEDGGEHGWEDKRTLPHYNLPLALSETSWNARKKRNWYSFCKNYHLFFRLRYEGSFHFVTRLVHMWPYVHPALKMLKCFEQLDLTPNKPYLVTFLS